MGECYRLVLAVANIKYYCHLYCRHEGIKCLVICITPVKVVISHHLCGVVASCEYFQEPVQFADVALSILTTLKATDRVSWADVFYGFLF